MLSGKHGGATVNHLEFVADCKARIVGLEASILRFQSHRLSFGNDADEITMGWIARDKAALVIAQKQLADAEAGI
jgi:hypothetical protein